MKTNGYSGGLIVGLFAVVVYGAIWADRQWPEPPKAGDCVVHACEECAKHLYARILFVRYNENVPGHAYCVYWENGETFAWDWRGAQLLEMPDGAMDARSVAIWLTVTNPPLENLSVKTAAYEWQSK